MWKNPQKSEIKAPDLCKINQPITPQNKPQKAPKSEIRGHTYEPKCLKTTQNHLEYNYNKITTKTHLK